MKLVKIDSNKPFHNTIFNPGFNVILGEPKDKGNKKKDTHNLGKSLLIQLIDFLLLKKNDHFFVKHQDKFLGYIFTLRLNLIRESSW